MYTLYDPFIYLSEVNYLTLSQHILSLEALTPGTSDHAYCLGKLRLLMASVATKGVRLDLQILLNKKELLCDFASIHTTAPSSIPALSKWRQDITEGLALAAGVAPNNPTARLPTPGIAKSVKAKQNKYRVLMQLAQAQYPRKRKIKPTLLIPVVTHSGGMSPDMITLIEIMTSEAASGYVPFGN